MGENIAPFNEAIGSALLLDRLIKIHADFGVCPGFVSEIPVPILADGPIHLKTIKAKHIMAAIIVFDQRETPAFNSTDIFFDVLKHPRERGIEIMIPIGILPSNRPIRMSGQSRFIMQETDPYPRLDVIMPKRRNEFAQLFKVAVVLPWAATSPFFPAIIDDHIGAIGVAFGEFADQFRVLENHFPRAFSIGEIPIVPPIYRSFRKNPLSHHFPTKFPEGAESVRRRIWPRKKRDHRKSSPLKLNASATIADIEESVDPHRIDAETNEGVRVSLDATAFAARFLFDQKIPPEITIGIQTPEMGVALKPFEFIPGDRKGIRKRILPPHFHHSGMDVRGRQKDIQRVFLWRKRQFGIPKEAFIRFDLNPVWLPHQVHRFVPFERSTEIASNVPAVQPIISWVAYSALFAIVPSRPS